MSFRMTPADRRDDILAAAVRTAAAIGFTRMTRDDIARTADTSAGLVSARLGTMEKLRDAVMLRAVLDEVLIVVAEGIATRHRHALRAPEALRRKALQSLLEIQ